VKTNKPKDNPWKAVALVSAIGFDLVVCMAAGYFGGSYMSRLAGGKPIWIVAGIVLGLAVGIAGVVLLLRTYTEGSE
jgi:F0F1-type ATP synthase assembly protein I